MACSAPAEEEVSNVGETIGGVDPGPGWRDRPRPDSERPSREDADALLDPGTDEHPDGEESDADARGDVLLDAEQDDGGGAPPGAFGSTCAEHSDCSDEACLRTEGGKTVCSQSCEDDCPDGWLCRLMKIDGAPRSVCVLRALNLCRPCRNDLDCQQHGGRAGDLCLPTTGDPSTPDGLGSFCGIACAEELLPCPEGYACEEILGPDGAPRGRQCVPDGGECGCNEWARADGSMTACGYGSCRGDRRCGEEGLSACTGKGPEPETCNGDDDDCDAEVDEDFMVDGAYLHVEHCGGCSERCPEIQDGQAACELVEGEPTCVLEECHPGYVEDGQGGCEPPPEAHCTPCGTGEDCLHGLTCTALGAGEFCLEGCAPGDGSCPDGMACREAPGGGSHLCLPPAGGCGQAGGPCARDGDCEDLDPCTTERCDGGATCAYEPFVCDDGDPCTADLCEAYVGCKSEPGEDDVPCEDGDPCTVDDRCEAGLCAAGAPNPCEDDNPCTDGSCGPEGCAYAPVEHSQACYEGPEGTEGKGTCAPGVQTCHEGELGPCEGAVLPEDEVCDSADNNCDGTTDEGCGYVAVDLRAAPARLFVPAAGDAPGLELSVGSGVAGGPPAPDDAPPLELGLYPSMSAEP